MCETINQLHQKVENYPRKKKDEFTADLVKMRELMDVTNEDLESYETSTKTYNEMINLLIKHKENI
jgi:hypothetical protein